MSKIIFSTINGDVTREAVMSKASMFRTKIYIDDAENLIGFRRRLPYYEDHSTELMTQYIELDHFIGMLYEGDPKAFDILFIDPVHIEGSTLEFDMIKEKAQMFLTGKLVKNLIIEAKERFENISDRDFHSEKNDNEFHVRLFEYHKQNAYFCLRNLMLIISIIKDEKYEITSSNSQVLEGVLDGVFSKTGLTQGFEDYLGQVEKLQEKLELPFEPDLEDINELVLKIRNVEIIDKNIAEIE